MPKRPKGFDYSAPDPVENRCQKCNPDGTNRTGLMVIGLINASTIAAAGIRCPGGCDNGLIIEENQ